MALMGLRNLTYREIEVINNQAVEKTRKDIQAINDNPFWDDDRKRTELGWWLVQNFKVMRNADSTRKEKLVALRKIQEMMAYMRKSDISIKYYIEKGIELSGNYHNWSEDVIEEFKELLGI